MVFFLDEDIRTPMRGYRLRQQEYFVQNDWRARRDLTLNLGVRYGFFGVWREVNNALSNLFAVTLKQGGKTMADIFHQFPIKASGQQVFQAVATPTGLDAWWTPRSSGQPTVGQPGSSGLAQNMTGAQL